MAEVFYFGENWILTLKLTVRRGWYIIKSRHHPNTSAVQGGHSTLQHRLTSRVMLCFEHGNSLTKGKGKESQEGEAKKRKPQQTENTPQPKGHAEAAGTL